MKGKKKNHESPMDKLTAGYEQFIKGKKTAKNGKKLFNEAIKKSTKPRGSK